MGIPLYNIANGLCLSASTKTSGSYVIMALCSTPELTKWDFVDIL